MRKRYSIKVKRITVQPDKYKPLNLDPVELEVLHLKRAKIEIEVEVEGKRSEFLCVVEYRGKMMTITRTEGTSNVMNLGQILMEDYFFRYDTEGPQYLASSKDGSRAEFKLLEPEEFEGYLHFIHNRGGLRGDLE